MRYLKQQERRQQTTVSESEKLQRLKDRVESQEAKLKKIRAMRGQVDYSKVINGNLCMCSSKEFSFSHYNQHINHGAGSLILTNSSSFLCDSTISDVQQRRLSR